MYQDKDGWYHQDYAGESVACASANANALNIYRSIHMNEADKLDLIEKQDMETFLNTASIFSKKGCKKCCQRGYNVYDMVDRKDPGRKYLRYCDCVYKNMKKYS